jgi:hypothetical protein
MSIVDPPFSIFGLFSRYAFSMPIENIRSRSWRE